MRLVLRLILAIVLVAALAVVVLAVGLPRLLEGSGFRETLAAQVRAQTGSEFHYDSLRIGWLPPRLEIEGPIVAGPREGAPAIFAADSAALMLALGPLFSGELEVTLVSLVSAELRLLRTADGITIESAVPLPTGDAPSDEAVASESALAALEIKHVELRDANLTLVDRSAAAEGGEAVWRLSDLDADITNIGSRAPLEVRASAASLEGSDISLEGPFKVRLSLAPPLGTLTGPFAVDLVETDIVVGEAFLKPAGTPATFEGELVERAGGALGIDGTLELHTLSAPVEIDFAERSEIRIPQAALSLAGWDALLPAVADYEPSGVARFEGLTATLSPLSLSGQIELDGVEVLADLGAEGSPPQRIGLRGALVGTGSDGVALRDMIVSLPGGDVAMVGSITRLESAPQYDLRMETPSPLASNPLVNAVAAVADVIFGPLSFDLALSGPLDQLLQNTQGHVQFELGGEEAGGRIAGVSLLGDTVGRLGTLAATATQLAGVSEQSGQLKGYLGDEFKLLGGRFDVADGLARTENLRIEYRGYTVSLAGTMGLLDASLDMTGTIELAEEVDKLITGGSKRRKIDLARIGGTVAAPEVGIAAASLTTSLAESLLGEGSKQLDEQVGKGLRKLFGKKRE